MTGKYVYTPQLQVRGKGGPSSYLPMNQAVMKPRKGAKGATGDTVKPGKRMARTHEAAATKPRRKRGYGKIASTSQPRFTRFSQF
jgi:hypothetical protein